MKTKAIFVLIATVLLCGCSGENPIHQDSVEITNESEAANSDSQNSNENDIIYDITLDIWEFTGTEKDSTPISTVNSKEFTSAVFCFNDNTVYFSWEGTVYSYDEISNEFQPIFEANAYNLNYWDNCLYYIDDEKYEVNLDKIHAAGPLFRYSLSDNTLTQLCENDISLPVVTEDGIFYTKYAYVGDAEPIGIYRLDEADGTSGRLYNGMSYIEYSGLHLSYIPAQNENESIKYCFNKENEAFLLKDVVLSADCIVGDNFYFRSDTDGTLNRMSMLTGEITASLFYDDEFLKKYNLLDEFKQSERKFSFSDYTVLNNEIWFAGFGLNRYNETENTFETYETGFYITALYSSNNSLYGIISDDGTTFLFAKLTPSETSVEREILGLI